MTKEGDPSGLGRTPITGLYLDLPTRTVSLVSGEHVVGVLKLAPEGVIFEARQPVPADTPLAEVNAGTPVTPAAPQLPEGLIAETEKRKPVTLEGKLKSKPREGRPDSRGNRTAWARFAAHEEDHEGAHMYSATFHKHTTEVALRLEKDAAVTVQGYPHANGDPGTQRMDTLSVINLLDYPGKSGGK